MSSQSAPAPEAPAPGKGEFARLAGVLTDPKVAFADIVVHPRWWVPLALVVVLAIVYMATYSRHVGWEGYMRHTIETSSRTQNLPVEQRERIIEQQTRLAPVFGYVMAAVGMPIVALVTAAVLLFVFKLMLDAQLTFRQVFAVTCYSFLTGVLSVALSILVMFLKNPEDFNLQDPLGAHLGSLLDPEAAPKWLAALASSFDLFTLWTMLLLATGLSVAARKLSWGKSLAGVVAPWVVWVAVKVGWRAIFG